jgi:hypothetical protein
MKKSNILTMIPVFFVLFTSGMYAQTKPGLNQVELLKQFIGNWKCETHKDTVLNVEIKAYGDGGLEFKLKGVTQGKVCLELKQLWGYDKKSDKVIVAMLVKGSPYIILQSTWFTDKDKYLQVPFEFASNPDQADFKVEFDIKSPDIVLRNEIVNNKSIVIETYKKVK